MYRTARHNLCTWSPETDKNQRPAASPRWSTAKGRSRNRLEGLGCTPIGASETGFRTVATSRPTSGRSSALGALVGFALILGLLPLGLLPTVARGEDWPQFRGPNCTGISTTSMSLPTVFSATENVRWSSDVGEGVGCPVVAAGRVFVTSMVDDETVGLLALDAKTGELLWRRTWDVGPLPEVHNTNSHASTTPATHNTDLK